MKYYPWIKIDDRILHVCLQTTTRSLKAILNPIKRPEFLRLHESHDDGKPLVLRNVTLDHCNEIKENNLSKII
jgi:hypothetical protein